MSDMSPLWPAARSLSTGQVLASCISAYGGVAIYLSRWLDVVHGHGTEETKSIAFFVLDQFLDDRVFESEYDGPIVVDFWKSDT